MAVEIERKFLPAGDGWRAVAGTGERIRQGYVCAQTGRTVRVRTRGVRGFLCVKGALTGLARPEFEYEIPLADAEAMLDALCERPLIEKIRYLVEAGGHTWEIDEFFGDNDGLVVAEVELEREDEAVALPGWVGREVTGDMRYQNSNLVSHPYREWRG